MQYKWHQKSDFYETIVTSTISKNEGYGLTLFQVSLLYQKLNSA